MHTAERVCKVLTSRLVRDPIRHSNLRSTRPAVAWPCIYLVEQAALTATRWAEMLWTNAKGHE